MKTTPATEDLGFLTDYAGQGLEDMKGKAVAVPYLSMVQPGSQAVADGAVVGHWRNSATGEDYGEQVNVIVLDFRLIWAERSDDPNVLTVARYMPNSIQVEIKQPPKGQKGFATMVNPETGNEIQEQFMYVVVLPDHPDAGYLLFNPAVGNMKACRSWNSRLRGQLIPTATGGTVQAPVFASIWTLALNMVQNPKRKGEQIARLVVVGRQGFVEEGLFRTTVEPQLTSAKQELLALNAADGEDAVAAE